MPDTNFDLNTPLEDTSPVVNNDVPKVKPTSSLSFMIKQMGGGKAVSALFGMLLLAGGVGAGIVLVSQPQLLNQMAQTKTEYDSCPGYWCDNCDNPPTLVCQMDTTLTCQEWRDRNCPASECRNGDEQTCLLNTNYDGTQICENGKWGKCIGDLGYGDACNDSSQCANGYYCRPDPDFPGTCQPVPNPPYCERDKDPGAPLCCSDTNCVNGEKVCELPKRLECKTGNSWCTIDAVSDLCGGDGNPGPTATPPTSTIRPSATPTPTPSRSPISKPTLTPTPTPTIPPTAQCLWTGIYTPAWTPVTIAEFYNFSARSQVYFCTRGIATSGTFDKARFTINGILRNETYLQNPNSTSTNIEYCDLYTIPTNTYSFTVQGEIHHTTLGWQ